MKSRIMIVVLLILAGNLFAQKIGGFIIGINHAPTDKDNKYNIASNGISCGFIIPINIDSKLNIAFKFKTCYHLADYYMWDENTRVNNYFCATDEFMVGYRKQVTDKLLLNPQIGFGAMGEVINSNNNEGYSDVNLFIDFSLTLTYNFGSFNLGPIINYEMGLSEDYGNMFSTDRLLFSLAIMK